MIQIGTPEELVIRPATDYVAECTCEVSRAGVLSVCSVMRPAATGQSQGDYAGEVRPDMRVSEITIDVDTADRLFAVRGDDGRLLGELMRDDLIAVLIGRDRR